MPLIFEITQWPLITQEPVTIKACPSLGHHKKMHPDLQLHGSQVHFKSIQTFNFFQRDRCVKFL